MKLNKDNIPSELHSVIHFAEKWGIGDDYDREQAISDASRKELENVAHCLDNIENAALARWLIGPESKREPLSQEYLAVTNLTMAVHSAKLELKKMDRK